MDKIAIYKEEIHKEAATKVQKLINAGLLSEQAQELAYKAPKITNNIHNKINAKALRQSGGNFTKKQMNANRYKKMSKIDSLPSRAAVDTQRILKQQGRENAKVISAIRNDVGKENVRINKHNNKVFDGGHSFAWRNSDGEFTRHEFKIPDKTVKKSPYDNIKMDKKSMREARALTARHELNGESVAAYKTRNALQLSGYDVDKAGMDAAKINGHQNPDVLIGDAKMVKRLSPKTRKAFIEKNKRNLTGLHAEGYKNQKELNEAELTNVLKSKDLKVTNKKQENEVAKNLLDSKIPTHKDRKTMTENMVKINIGNKDASKKFSDAYHDLDFFVGTGKKLNSERIEYPRKAKLNTKNIEPKKRIDTQPKIKPENKKINTEIPKREEFTQPKNNKSKVLGIAGLGLGATGIGVAGYSSIKKTDKSNGHKKTSFKSKK